MIQTRPQRPRSPAIIYKTPSGHAPVFLGRPSEGHSLPNPPPLPSVRPIAAATRQIEVAPARSRKAELWFGMVLGGLLVLLTLATCYLLGLYQLLPR